MPPPPRRQPPAGVNVQQLLRARQAQGLEIPPDMLRAFEETQTPAQQAEFQQRYAQGPAPMLDPNQQDVWGTRILADAPVFNLFGAPPAPPAPVVIDPTQQSNTPVIDPFGGTPRRPQVVTRPGAAQDAPADSLGAPRNQRPRRPVTRYGRAPGGGGDATYGDPGNEAQTGDGGVDQSVAPSTGVGTRPNAPSLEQGGAAGRVRVLPGITERGIEVSIDGHPVYIPFGGDINQVRTWVMARASEGSGGGQQGTEVDLRDPNNPRFDQNTANAIMERLGDAFQPYWQAPAATGPGGPRMDATVSQQMVFPGQADPATQFALLQAGQDTSRAMGAYQGAQGMLSAGQEMAGAALGAAQQAGAQQAMQEAQARAERLQGQLQAVQQRIDDVSQMRVSQEEAFGGMGGRIGAGIAVALGQLGSALGGGPNAALAIVNGIVDRNLRAQESNIANQRAGAQMAGNALQQMRGILGDEAAAREAARAMHLAGFQNQLQGMLAGLTGDARSRGQELLAMIQRERGLAEQAAAQMAATTSRMSVSTRVRGSQEQVQGAIASLAAQARPQPAAPTPQQSTAPTMQQTVTGAMDTLDRERQRVEAGGTPAEGMGTPSAPRPQTRTGARPQARRQTRPVPEAAPQEGSAAQPAPRQIVRPRSVPSPEDVVTAQNEWRSDSQRPTPPPYGRFLRTSGEGGGTIDPRAASAFEAAWNGTGAERATIRQALTDSAMWGRWTPSITRSNTEFGVELTNSEPAAARARGRAWVLRSFLRHALTGASFTSEEIEDYMNQLPDPNGFTAESVTDMWNSFTHQWESIANAMLERNAMTLAPFGVEPDAAQRLSPEMNRVLNARLRSIENAPPRERETQRPTGNPVFDALRSVSPLPIPNLD